LVCIREPKPSATGQGSPTALAVGAKVFGTAVAAAISEELFRHAQALARRLVGAGPPRLQTALGKSRAVSHWVAPIKGSSARTSGRSELLR
jgi:hypothetical protein